MEGYTYKLIGCFGEANYSVFWGASEMELKSLLVYGIKYALSMIAMVYPI